MKKMMLLTMVLMTLLLSAGIPGAEDLTAPKEPTAPILDSLNVNYAFMYNLETKKISKAPSVDVTLLTAYDGVLQGNIKAAFTAKDNNEYSVVFGPALGFNPVPLFAKSKNIKIAKNFNLNIGLGVVFDVVHIDGISLADWRKVTYPTFSLGLSF